MLEIKSSIIDTYLPLSHQLKKQLKSERKINIQRIASQISVSHLFLSNLTKRGFCFQFLGDSHALSVDDLFAQNAEIILQTLDKLNRL